MELNGTVDTLPSLETEGVTGRVHTLKLPEL